MRRSGAVGSSNVDAADHARQVTGTDEAGIEKVGGTGFTVRPRHRIHVEASRRFLVEPGGEWAEHPTRLVDDDAR